jgi:hypothetical protein
MSKKIIGLDDVRPGDVILFPPHKGDWIAQCIAYLTQSEVNHAAWCYDDKGKKKILESVLEGVTLRDFDETVSKKYPLRIKRLKTPPADMTKLMNAGRNYIEHKDDYPFFDLAMLAMLLLFKKFSENKLVNEIMYQVLCKVAFLLMDAVQERYKNKNPMTCSQFTAQCFTDAGEDFNLQFHRLYVDYDTDKSSADISFIELIINSISRSGARAVSGGMTIDGIDSAGMNKAFNEKPIVVTESGDALFTNFKKLMEQEVSGARGVGFENKITKEYATPLAQITMGLYLILSKDASGKIDIKKAEEYLTNQRPNNSTARNFFVAPEDIFFNCSNLEDVGLLAY